MSLRFLASCALALAALRLAAQSANEGMPTAVESDGPMDMVSDDHETTITFHDGVRASGRGLQLTCDELRVVVIRTSIRADIPGTTDRFRSFVATGHVHLLQGDYNAVCGRAEVTPGGEQVILSEHPVVFIVSKKMRQAGRKIVIGKDHRIEIEDPVTTLPDPAEPKP